MLYKTHESDLNGNAFHILERKTLVWVLKCSENEILRSYFNKQDHTS